MPSKLDIRHRIGWGIADQALSSLTNFGLTLIVARSVPRAEFGRFSLIFGVYVVVSGVGQAVAAGPLAIRHSSRPRTTFEEAVKSASGATLLLGIGSGILCVMIGRLVTGAGSALLALGVMLPGLLVQDTLRFSFVAQGRPAKAAINDGAWALMQLGGLGAILVSGHESTTAFVLAWGGSATAAALLGCVQAGLVPQVAASREWLRYEGQLAFLLATEALTVRASVQVTMLIIGAIAGLDALASIRGAQVLLSPLNPVFLGGFLVGVPEVARHVGTDRRLVVRHVQWTSAVTVLIALSWCVVVLALSRQLGPELLGATWSGARPLIALVGLQYVATACTVGPQVGLRALAAADTSVRCQALQSASAVWGAAIGAALGGAYGAGIGIAAASGIGAVVWWLAIRRRIEADWPDAEGYATG